MMVDINLLDEKEKRNIAPYLFLFCTIVMVLSMSLFIMTSHNHLQEEKASVEESISRIQTEQKLLQQTNSNDKQAARDDLQEKAITVEATLFPTVDLLERMVALLPKDGYFLTYAYEGSGEVTIDTQFDSMQDLAKYTNALNQEDYIDDVSVSMETQDVLETQNGGEILPRYLAHYSIQMEEAKYEKGQDTNED
ncbi:PilN domain-containing protein [Pontibacillus salicampi]|uniref:PilN domain-containing protein n=1 Tax=Pontibacillus salicampi TaxID=1449801 RepID=A0ABV6LJB4_9BACI